MSFSITSWDYHVTLPVAADVISDEPGPLRHQTPPVMDEEGAKFLRLATERRAWKEAFLTQSNSDPLAAPSVTYFVGLNRDFRVTIFEIEQRLNLLSDPATGVYGVVRVPPVFIKMDRAGRNEHLLSLSQLQNISTRTLLDAPEVKRRFRAAKIDAIRFAAKLPANVRKPRVSVAEDGEIVLEWTGENRRAVVDFEGDDHFGYALLQQGRFSAGEHAGDLQEEKLPPDLLHYLNELAASA